jgi:Protein of unknown function (DUF2975)
MTPLAMSRTALRALIKLNMLVGVLILALFVASVIWGGPVMRALGVRPAADSAALILGMRGIMWIGILGVPLAHIVFTRLLAIVETVNAGDPFIVENAVRLQTIAWAVVALEILNIAAAIIARASAGTQKLDIAWSFSVTRLLAILLLFVLARVFAEGARMRDELAATV